AAELHVEAMQSRFELTAELRQIEGPRLGFRQLHDAEAAPVDAHLNAPRAAGSPAQAHAQALERAIQPERVRKPSRTDLEVRRAVARDDVVRSRNEGTEGGPRRQRFDAEIEQPSVVLDLARRHAIDQEI